MEDKKKWRKTGKNMYLPVKHIHPDRLFRARGIKLVLAVVGKQTPVLLTLGLTIVTSAVRLPGLIKCLEVEEINTPGQHTADTLLPEGLRILGASLSGLIVGTTIYKKSI